MLEKHIKGYQKKFKKYGVDPRALQWSSGKAAKLRYVQLVVDIDFNGKKVLDIGCGFGDIITYIEKKTKKFSYTGVDIVPEFITVAKKEYPKHKFIVRDYFENPLKKSFDIIMSSGTLNANVKGAVSYRKKAIKIMLAHAKEAVIFNMAGSSPQPKNKKENRVYYADSYDILKFCLTLSSKLIFRSNYHSKDFTIVICK